MTWLEIYGLGIASAFAFCAIVLVVLILIGWGFERKQVNKEWKEITQPPDIKGPPND